MARTFKDRVEAGRLLAEALKAYREPDVPSRAAEPARPAGPQAPAQLLVLGLPRGGVPVASEIARALAAELDVMIVRKLGLPGQEELAMGAIASGGVRVLNQRVLQAAGVDNETLQWVTGQEQRELERRERTYRGDRPRPEIQGRTVILVDDGLATGSTMRAALSAVRQQRAAKVIVAAPVAPPETIEQLQPEADEVVCLEAPAGFFGISQWYEDFSQTTDEEVRRLLQQAWDAASAGRSDRPRE